ncbi:uncharacterized protein N7496_010322 [Penicillium cataractarum]|uniref:NACHT domain-containing protein n=1 Tax=Penicillium cataractarum TaxID=2100454 RepID=A0A9W9RTA5_9EURO|nr:uncharacterized protein N7496_010322 [Penicillium cataractarum]KAJ5364609.1 hypothetical protein N7496_010322 [Penicillium cataractarum]
MRQQGTGLWFLDSPEFQSWLSQPKQVLFCPGIPGAGKTIMSSIVIDFLKNKFAEDLEVKTAFLFCSYQSQHAQRSDDLLSSILRQLAYKDSGELCSHVYDLYKSMPPNDCTALDHNLVAPTLSCTASSYKRIFIVIDGLDELGPSKPEQQQTLLSELFKLQKVFPVNILATSRFVSEILGEFEEYPQKEIRAVDEDVLSYANTRIPLLVRGTITSNPATQDEVRKSIVTSADGMFLLATLHLDHLMGFPTVGELKEALPLLSRGETGLFGAYDLAIERIKAQAPSCARLATKVLSWLTYGRRPLYEDELQHALATRDNMSELDPEFMPPAEMIDSFCAGLVIRERDTKIVRLVHYTTKEYLLGSALLSNAEAELARSCLAYLCLPTFSVGRCSSKYDYKERLNMYALYDYGAKYWGAHAAAVMADCTEIEVSVHKLLSMDCYVSAASQGLILPPISQKENKITDVSMWGPWSRCPSQVTGMHLAAHFGLRDVMAYLLNHNEDLLAMDSRGQSPLVYAAEAGHTETVRFILAASGNKSIDTKDADGQTPLLAAISKGNNTLAKLLIDLGADINEQNEQGHSALSLAARVDNVVLMQTLLDKGANVNAANMSGATPLHEASRVHNVDFVKVLLEKGALVDPLEKTPTPLQYALYSCTVNKCSFEAEETVRLLLEA